MPALGATLEDLQALASQLRATTGDIGEVSTSTQTQIKAIVEQLRSSGSQAVTTARNQMQALRTSVNAAQSRADGADWTGHNAEVFRHAYQDFNQSMTKAEEATTSYFEEFNTLLDKLGGDTEHYLGEFTTSMGNAQTSTDSMATAVDAQHQNLDQVMNTGMSVG
jgi:uncharacterized protein YukE